MLIDSKAAVLHLQLFCIQLCDRHGRELAVKLHWQVLWLAQEAMH
jgi:hypothetical protein